jgi:hypothetical protein
MNVSEPRKSSLFWAWFIVPPVILVAVGCVIFGPHLWREATVRRVQATGGAAVVYDTPVGGTRLLRRIPGLETWGDNIAFILIRRNEFPSDESFIATLHESYRLEAPLTIGLAGTANLEIVLDDLPAERVQTLYFEDQQLNSSIFSRLKRFKQVKSLGFLHCQFDNIELALLKDFPLLTDLCFDQSSINDEGMRQLFDVRKLRDLGMSQTAVSEGVKEELCRKLPNVSISDD